jgi:hypothetical protein
MTFRFILQPAMAAIAAWRDGVSDARLGRRPCLWALLSGVRGPEGRSETPMGGGYFDARILILGIVMDAIYQWLVKGRRPLSQTRQRSPEGLKPVRKLAPARRAAIPGLSLVERLKFRGSTMSRQDQPFASVRTRLDRPAGDQLFGRGPRRPPAEPAFHARTRLDGSRESIGGRARYSLSILATTYNIPIVLDRVRSRT